MTFDELLKFKSELVDKRNELLRNFLNDNGELDQLYRHYLVLEIEMLNDSLRIWDCQYSVNGTELNHRDAEKCKL